MRALGVGVCVAITAGCSPNMHDGLGPRVPIPTVFGTVTRDGAPAAAIHVELRDATGSTKIQSTTSDPGGAFGLPAGPGTWEVRASGSAASDFASVSRVFTTADGRASLPPLNLSADGAALLGPANHATMPAPPDSLAFRWRAPSRAVRSARVQVYDSTGAAVWYSSSSTDSVAYWNGRPNQGTAAGPQAAPGRYTWRIRFAFPDTTEARTGKRELLVP